MWIFREQKAVSRTQKAALATSRIVVFCLLLSAVFLLLTGCRRDMQDQPKAIAYRENSFFKDGTGSRPLVEGTVPRGYLREDRAFYFGKKPTAQATPQSPQTPSTQAALNSQAGLYPDDVDTIPMKITKADLDRGEERYNIYCSVCHRSEEHTSELQSRLHLVC